MFIDTDDSKIVYSVNNDVCVCKKGIKLTDTVIKYFLTSKTSVNRTKTGRSISSFIFYLSYERHHEVRHFQE